MKKYSLILSLACCFSIPCLGHELGLTQSAISPFLERHSGRSYDSSHAVSREQIQFLIEAARSAPSSNNEQPWSFIICDRTTNPQAYEKVFDCLIEFNQNWAKNAPLLIVISANTQSEKTQTTNRWGTFDTGAAATCMALAASSIGLMAHQMGGFDEFKIQSALNIPSKYIPMSIMAIGYETLEEAQNIPAKTRRPLNENFFLGAWGVGFESQNSK